MHYWVDTSTQPPRDSRPGVGAKLPGECEGWGGRGSSYSLGFPPKKLQDIAKAVRGGTGDVAWPRETDRESGAWSPACLCLTCYQ